MLPKQRVYQGIPGALERRENADMNRSSKKRVFVKVLSGLS